jgi:hypothetical protein
MKCADAVEQILEADPVDLCGDGDSLLAQHLRGCTKCQALAQVVIDEEGILAVQMAEVVSSTDPDEILDRSLGPSSARRIPGHFKRAGFALLPLAAAAGIASLFLAGEPPLPGSSYAPPTRTPDLGLEVPEGRNAALLRTNNPDITVLWFF